MSELAEIQVPVTVAQDDIRTRIHTIRGMQVILDSDLAVLYRVETRVFNQAVKRNSERFPENFRFQLTAEEHRLLLSQIVTAKRERGAETRGGHHNRPFVFTEQGIAMLAGVLKSEVAVQASIRIMNTFVAMRQTLATMAPLLSRIEATERRQLKQEDAQARNEVRFAEIFDAMNDKKFPPQKVFFDGEFFDAFEQMKRFVRSAKKELIVIDPYFDDSVLALLAQKRPGVMVTVVQSTRGQRNLHAIDVAQFNQQYANSLTVKVTDKFHDRFLIIDQKTLIHIGASLNYLGKKCFGFSTMDAEMIPDILARIP